MQTETLEPKTSDRGNSIECAWNKSHSIFHPYATILYSAFRTWERRKSFTSKDPSEDVNPSESPSRLQPWRQNPSLEASRSSVRITQGRNLNLVPLTSTLFEARISGSIRTPQMNPFNAGPKLPLSRVNNVLFHLINDSRRHDRRCTIAVGNLYPLNSEIWTEILI
jgi:hypothetical protein